MVTYDPTAASTYTTVDYKNTIDISNVTGEKYIVMFNNCGAWSGYQLWSKLQNLTLFKKDDWEFLSDTATTIDEILADSENLLNNKEKVDYMIYNCTGNFMAAAITSETFLMALNNSPYKTKIYANEHWNKFLAMVA
jgi:hypothetical protein